MRTYIFLGLLVLTLAGCSSLDIRGTDPSQEPSRYPFPGASTNAGGRS